MDLETFNALNPDGGNSNTLYGLNKAMREGTRIRNKVKDVLSQTNPNKYPDDVFDNIDDDTIERNIPLAEEALEMNENKGINKDIAKNHPYYRDATAMIYAADELGNKKAVQAS